jgi:cobalt/nickel transport system permease protein
MKMSKMKRGITLAAMVGLSAYLVVAPARPAQAMHIMEGFLPVGWAVLWGVVVLPFFILWALQLGITRSGY